ncbi:RBBP9/YdeN family alpha/beta hydrolase [Sinorhizobium meliloti]|uniref:RBBP9/YdeN family alpha/beta hydrolase n=1 Tax=Rhizobium meliloti TaxID=382 RepID=UPI000FD928EE|nr:alpha/beta fold hydrolase [Sinorhizobium meliloti]RVL88343.1 serine hydrolase family protein [Sinorhizobium meliloti]
MTSLASEVEVLILPGLNGSPDGHWQRYWALDQAGSRVVEQDDWTCPSLESWRARLEDEIAAADDDIWLVGHSLGCILAANLAERPIASRVRGALLVAPCDLETTEKMHPCVIKFGAMPLKRLPFPSLVVGSLDDPYMSIDLLRLTARAWGSALVDIGAAGHINIASGFGHWQAGYALLELLKSQGEGPAFNCAADRFFSSALAGSGLAMN